MAAFSARYDVPFGSQNLPEGKPWVDQVSRDEIQKEFEGWGPDVATLLQFMPEKTIRWNVHVVDPPLDSYAKGRVALLGDAVRIKISRPLAYGMWNPQSVNSHFRHMRWCPISELGLAKVWKTPFC